MTIRPRHAQYIQYPASKQTILQSKGFAGLRTFLSGTCPDLNAAEALGILKECIISRNPKTCQTYRDLSFLFLKVFSSGDARQGCSHTIETMTEVFDECLERHYSATRAPETPARNDWADYKNPADLVTDAPAIDYVLSLTDYSDEVSFIEGLLQRGGLFCNSFMGWSLPVAKHQMVSKQCMQRAWAMIEKDTLSLIKVREASRDCHSFFDALEDVDLLVDNHAVQASLWGVPWTFEANGSDEELSKL